MEWSISEVARMSGTTSRALRHYDATGLLRPSRVAENGYRHYDERAVLRLQRILLLRGLGLGLARIRAVLDHEEPETAALRRHLEMLHHERDRLGRQIAAVESTITAWEERGELMVETMFDGFDHTRYEPEVAERWGAGAAARSNEWWTALDDTGRATWQGETAALAAAWRAAAERRVDPASDEARTLAHRHVEWLRHIPGTPASAPDGDTDAYVRGLADLYVADPRFGSHYGGDDGARFARDALNGYLDDLA